MLESAGEQASRNVYWFADGGGAGRGLSAMPPQSVSLSASLQGSDRGAHLIATLKNTGSAPALNAKLTLLGADGIRILPTSYSDNYISLMPGEVRQVVVTPNTDQPLTGAKLALRGWDVRETTISFPATVQK